MLPAHTKGSRRRDFLPWEMLQMLTARRQLSLFGGKFVRGDGVVALAGVPDYGRELRLIRGIGKVLGFQAEGVAAGIGEAALAAGFAVEEIAGVKLDAGLGGPNFEDAAGGGVDDARGR